MKHSYVRNVYQFTKLLTIVQHKFIQVRQQYAYRQTRRAQLKLCATTPSPFQGQHLRLHYHANCHADPCEISVPRQKKTLAPLQRVLHAAARNVLDLKLGDHVTPALRELHWLPIAERIQYKLCLLVHKMSVGHAPDYIASLLMPVSDIPSRSSLR